jgi:hypothetical protein
LTSKKFCPFQFTERQGKGYFTAVTPDSGNPVNYEADPARLLGQRLKVYNNFALIGKRLSREVFLGKTTVQRKEEQEKKIKPYLCHSKMVILVEWK